jgi:hypothetical protein
MPPNTLIPRYGGYIHSNPNYEDFGMWNSVCEDAEPDWESRNAERAEREERERVARQAVRREEERRELRERERVERERMERERVERERERVERVERAEREQLEKEQPEQERLEKEQQEKEAMSREQERGAKQTLATKEATRKEQEKKEQEQKEKREKNREAALALNREAVKKEIQKRADIAKATQEAEQQLQQTEMEANDAYCQRWIETVESGLPFASRSERQEPASDISADLTQRLLDLLRRRNAEKTESENDKPQAERGESVDPDLATELNHLRDILTAIAESLRAEQVERRENEETERAKSEDTTKNQPSAASWYAGCSLM